MKMFKLMDTNGEINLSETLGIFGGNCLKSKFKEYMVDPEAYRKELGYEYFSRSHLSLRSC